MDGWQTNQESGDCKRQDDQYCNLIFNNLSYFIKEQPRHGRGCSFLSTQYCCSYLRLLTAALSILEGVSFPFTIEVALVAIA
jgi:hypothetical protein